MSRADEVRRYLRRQHHGVLATHSQKLPGYPFASIVPFVLDHEACPVILISELAEHTKNLRADPHASLLAQDLPQDGDIQAGSRATIVGDAEPIENPGALAARHVRYLPDAARLIALGDFRFWRIRPVRVRYIAGFGAINWVEPSAYTPPPNSLADAEESVVAHMNADHREALGDYCRHVHAVAPEVVEMAGVDCDGFDVRADGRLLRFDFETPVTSPGGLRAALVELAKAARDGSA